MSRKRSGLAGWLLLACATALPVRLVWAEGMDDFLFADSDRMRSVMQAELPDPSGGYWFEDPELRVAPEVDINDLRTETYSLRFRPVSRKERRFARGLHQVEIQLARTQWSKALSGTLARRYRQLIELAEMEQELALLGAHLSLDRSLLESQQTLSATADYSPAKLLNLSVRLEQRELELRRVARATERLRGATVADYLVVRDTNTPALSARLVGPDAITSVLNRLATQAVSNSPESTLARLDVERAQREVELERSRTGFGLNLMELSYENKGTDSYNFTVGFRLPFAQRSRSMQRRTRELISAGQRARLTQQSVTETVQNSIRSLRIQIDAYAADTSALRALEQRLRESAADAEAYALLRRRQLELSGSAAGVHAGMLQDFVELLDLLGLLQQAPLKNWIAGDRR